MKKNREIKRTHPPVYSIPLCEREAIIKTNMQLLCPRILMRIGQRERKKNYRNGMKKKNFESGKKGIEVNGERKFRYENIGYYSAMDESLRQTV